MSRSSTSKPLLAIPHLGLDKLVMRAGLADAEQHAEAVSDAVAPDGYVPLAGLGAVAPFDFFGGVRKAKDVWRDLLRRVHLRSLVLVGLLTSWEGEEEGGRFRPVIVTRCQARSDRARGAVWRKVQTAALRPSRGHGLRRFLPGSG